MKSRIVIFLGRTSNDSQKLTVSQISQVT